METRDPQRYGEWGAAERLVPALILIGIGALLLLSNLHIPFFREWWRYWPAILVAVGVVKLVDSPTANGRKGGAILLIIGGIFLTDNLGLLNFNWSDMWPLVLIGVGVWMLIDRAGIWGVDQPGGARVFNRRIREAAVFGGGKRKYAGREFPGGKFDCVFGGFEIDLRGATITGDSAVLEINAVFGGAEVRIPETWNADLMGAGVFGAFTDNTAHPAPQTPGLKQLIFKGSAVFGGVNIKN